MYLEHKHKIKHDINDKQLSRAISLPNSRSKHFGIIVEHLKPNKYRGFNPTVSFTPASLVKHKWELSLWRNPDSNRNELSCSLHLRADIPYCGVVRLTNSAIPSVRSQTLPATLIDFKHKYYFALTGYLTHLELSRETDSNRWPHVTTSSTLLETYLLFWKASERL